MQKFFKSIVFYLFMKYEHFGVAVVVTNPKRNLFYLQQKDKGCPIPEFRLTYCFFGGTINPAKEEFSGLKRELSEELENYPAELITENSRKLFDDYFLNIFKQKTKFSLYEAALSDKILKEISGFPIKEGKGGFLIKKQEILKIRFLPDLENTLKKYLSLIKKF